MCNSGVKEKDSKKMVLADGEYTVSVLPDFAMTIEEMSKRRTAFKKYVAEQLIKGSDYGTIQGCGNKPSLFKPGAEKVLALYGLTARMTLLSQREEMDANPPFVNFVYKCEIIWNRPDGVEIIRGDCEGEANSAESRFRRGGDIRQQNNTMRKMCQKRAMVGATLAATGCSDEFTQDIEDMSKDERGNGTYQKGAATKKPAVNAEDRPAHYEEMKELQKVCSVIMKTWTATVKDDVVTRAIGRKINTWTEVNDLDEMKEIHQGVLATAQFQAEEKQKEKDDIIASEPDGIEPDSIEPPSAATSVGPKATAVELKMLDIAKLDVGEQAFFDAYRKAVRNKKREDLTRSDILEIVGALG